MKRDENHYRSFVKAMNISFYPDARMHSWNRFEQVNNDKM